MEIVIGGSSDFIWRELEEDFMAFVPPRFDHTCVMAGHGANEGPSVDDLDRYQQEASRSDVHPLLP